MRERTWLGRSAGFLFAAAVQIMAGPGERSVELNPPVFMDGPETNGWMRIRRERADTVQVLEASSVLSNFTAIGLFHGSFDYLDPAAPGHSRRFYRVRERPRQPEDDWKNQIRLPDDEFLSAWPGNLSDGIRWIKFALLRNDPARLYFQKSDRYLFHYDFATARLDAFKGMSRSVFDEVSLHPDRQQVLLGTILLPVGESPEAPGPAEFGVQLVGLEPYAPEFVRDIVRLATSVVLPRGDLQPFYMPTFEQAEAARAQEAFLLSEGILLGSPERWLRDDACYAAGWNLGRLVFVTASEISAAVLDGRLRPTDILLTDGVPAEIPFVAGIISLSPSTPNSHVAILARSQGVPFVYVREGATREAIRALVGQEVALRVRERYDGCDLAMVPLDPALDPAFRGELMAIKAPRAIGFTPKAVYGGISAPVQDLTPADIRFFGGKAANFGLLRRVIPESAPDAIGLSFDLWDNFLGQRLLSGRSLREEIAAQLAGLQYPPELAELRAKLSYIRDLFTDHTDFTPAQKEAVISALGRFEASRKIRFRSSTNLEDTETFTGAGLYDSYSGCLLDDLDGDETGPSQCDAAEGRERGVFRAIKKVYASFYNENAYLERLRHGIDETQVGMAILVHHSYPDEEELANGVATITKEGTYLQGDLVTQAGAVSVTNPDSSAQPEIVKVSKFGEFGPYLTFQQRSSLVPLGGYVMAWETNYLELAGLLFQIAEGYQAMFPKKNRFMLDFEYKKVAPGQIEVKQVREVPVADTTVQFAPFLLAGAAELSVFQGEFGDVFSNHRLKSRLRARAENVRLSQTNTAAAIYRDLEWTHVNNGLVMTLTGSPTGWPNATHGIEGTDAVERWTLAEAGKDRPFELRTVAAFEQVSETDTPLRLISDLQLTLGSSYAQPVPVVATDREAIEYITNDVVRLVASPQRRPDDLLEVRTFSTRSGISVRTEYYWPKRPGGMFIYTAPLVAFVQTEIRGLTAEPIVLRDYFSQSYRPNHHNVGEHFVFEPRLEPGLSLSVRQELEAKNVRMLYFYADIDRPSGLQAIGADGVFRPLDN